MGNEGRWGMTEVNVSVRQRNQTEGKKKNLLEEMESLQMGGRQQEQREII